ncbi:MULTISPECIES: AarF/ABC1/UbiB kinase family protein [Acidithrix]|uniref:ABC1 kinase family protein n=1 Tax=Acidithrix TaxID=1609233 RepID=UPI001BCAB1A9|nr:MULTISPECIES: AarF/ABC1/UbiB kinase family protein [Acidithrix]
MNSSRIRRLSKLVNMGSKVAGRTIAEKALATFNAHEPGVPIDRSRQITTINDVAKELGSMRGVMTKFGQMLSYVSTPIPLELRSPFSSLQDSVPPMSKELVDEIIRQELGDGPDGVFAIWDPEPIAAASIGQVHRAVTSDGAAVAVKIQYPGIKNTITADLSNLRLIAKGLKLGYPSMDTDSMIDEIADRILEELDYKAEATNQRKFANFFEGHPTIVIPRVIADYSTEKLLTTELGEGVSFSKFQEYDQEAKDLASETIFRFVFRSLYQLRSFNGDPHPGNYLFGEDGRVTFLDFGLTKHFGKQEIEIFEHLIIAMVIDKDPVAFSASIKSAGLLSESCDLDVEQIYDHFVPFYESVMDNNKFAFNEDYTSRLFAHTFNQKAPIAKYLNVSPSFVVIQRINLGLYSILAALSAEMNFRGIAGEIWPFTKTPPSTDMGAREVNWLKNLDEGTAKQ